MARISDCTVPGARRLRARRLGEFRTGVEAGAAIVGMGKILVTPSYIFGFLASKRA
jgi:hypothetical protein